MEIVVERSVLERVEGFFNWLQDEVANKGRHTQHKALVADFVTNILIPDLTQLRQSPQTYEEKLEVPDELIEEPVQERVSRLAGDLKRALGGEIDRVMGAPQTDGSGSVTNQTAPVTTCGAAAPQTPVTVCDEAPNNGNGHKSDMKRKLLNHEKDKIRAFFISNDGIIEEDACVKFREEALDPIVAIFQVTGFVSYLHREIASGKDIVRQIDMVKYMAWMKKQKALWAQYNSAKYAGYRQKTQSQTVTQSGVAPSPKLVPGFRGRH